METSQIQQKFVQRRSRQRSLPVLFIVAVLGAALSQTKLGVLLFNAIGLRDPIPFFACVLLGVGVAVFSAINWRCPSCGKYLGNSMNPSTCGKCGIALGETSAKN